ncbi:MAG: hypothetical protein WD883_01330 [Candidatus Colwellbacteria bacterium]
MNDKSKAGQTIYRFPNGAVVSSPQSKNTLTFSEKKAAFQMASAAFSSLDSLSEIIARQQSELEMLYIQLRDANTTEKELHLRGKIRDGLALLYSTTDSYERMIINLASVDM